MDRYIAWNNALATRFFLPEAVGRPVYLFVTSEVISEVGQTIGQGREEFLAAVRAGPPGVTRSGHCQRALQVADGWRVRGLDYPPFIAYLALFVLAAGHEGDYAPQAYYPRLWGLLGEERTDPVPSFDRMLELWDDLEQWSVHDRRGELGVFEARIVGGKIHVGLPLAQTILTGAERTALPRMFADAQLDPSRAATSRELLRTLVVYGSNYLRSRTMRALEHGSEAFREALLDAVAEDFSSWDGSAPSVVEDQPAGSVFAGLRLCLAVDRVAGTIKTSLRVVARRDYPDEPLKLVGLASEVLECVEFYDGWSTPVRRLGSEVDYEPDQLAWESGLVGTDERVGWRVALEPAQVRIFIDGQRSMVPGLVEVLEMPRDEPFYIAFGDTAAGIIGEWLEADSDGWTPLGIATGLPSGWTLGAVARASSDRGVSEVRPGLGHPDRLSIKLVGGVRASRRNTYFSFAPPRLVIHGASATHQVRVDDRPVASSANSASTYELPDDLPADSRIGIEVLDGDDVVRRLSFYLVSGARWRFDNPPVTVDQFGDKAEGGIVCGAAVTALNEDNFPQDLLRTPGLGRPQGTVYFIGRRRGEIAVWPDDRDPRLQAVWAVPFRRRGRAIFCGSSLADADPLPEWVGDGSQRNLWHSLLWRRRREITPPSNRAEKSLWRHYRRSARGY